jgi:predicted CxxxxCH...CXXCH cytochrome family protein
MLNEKIRIRLKAFDYRILDTSTYDAATKTCSNVACHVAEQQPVWGRPYQYYTNSSATCYTCHPM